MAQQINLYSPILLTPKRHFSALAVVQALGVFALGLGALGLWSELETRELRQGMASALQGVAAEKQRLTEALARQPAPSDAAALEQELAQARRELAERQALLDELKGAADAAPPSALLRLLAQTTPPPVWLTDVQLAEQRVELAGMTLQPEALRPWLARLSADPLLAGRPLAAVKVEHAPTAAGTEAWSFRVVNGALVAEGQR